MTRAVAEGYEKMTTLKVVGVDTWWKYRTNANRGGSCRVGCPFPRRFLAGGPSFRETYVCPDVGLGIRGEDYNCGERGPTEYRRRDS